MYTPKTEQTLLLWGGAGEGLGGEIILLRELPLLKLEFKRSEWRTMKGNVTVEWFFNVITYKQLSDCYTVELHLSGRWLSGPPIVRLGSAWPFGYIFLLSLYYSFVWLKFSPQLSNTCEELCINILFVRE